ncbi:MAG: YciI family protein, partial [Marmoricola sp.]
HQAFAEAVVKAGAQVVGGDALQSPSTAVRITPANGDRAPVFTDGPFAETKEHLGGFAVVDVPDEESLRHWAGQIAIGCAWPQQVTPFMRPFQPIENE